MTLGDSAYTYRYDSTGRTDESAFSDAEEMGWDAYFESLFQRVDRKLLDEDKTKYQGMPALHCLQQPTASQLDLS